MVAIAESILVAQDFSCDSRAATLTLMVESPAAVCGAVTSRILGSVSDSATDSCLTSSICMVFLWVDCLSREATGVKVPDVSPDRQDSVRGAADSAYPGLADRSSLTRGHLLDVQSVCLCIGKE